MSTPLRQIRAHVTGEVVRVYQAFVPEIGAAAVRAQTFVAPFRRNRMTWIKPSFTWMMYRSGHGSKPGQECVLGVDIRREGFEWAIAHACLSSFDSAIHASYEEWRAQLAASSVRVQWDPERTVDLRELPWRSVQIGLGPEAVGSYVDRWIVAVHDMTPTVREIRDALRRGDVAAAARLLPEETPYPLPAGAAAHLGVSEEPTAR